MRIEQADRSSELWQRLRSNVSVTVDVDPDDYTDCVWLSLRAFEHANRYTTAPAGTDLEGERQPGQEGTR